MFEMLLSTNVKKALQFPNSGPGSITLSRGNEVLGFFGEVNDSDLITASDLVATFLPNASVSNIASDGLKWLKFVKDNTILFVPKLRICTNISWNTLYEAGLVYGTDDSGLFPTANPTNQLKYLLIGNDLFKIRLLTGADTDPSASNPSGQWPANFLNSEFALLYGSIVKNSGKPASVRAWDIYDSSTLSPSVENAWTQNTGTDTARGITWYYSYYIASMYSKTTGDSQRVWRPCLELVPNNGELIGVENVSSNGLSIYPTNIIENVAVDNLLLPIDYTTTNTDAPVVYLTSELQ